MTTEKFKLSEMTAPISTACLLSADNAGTLVIQLTNSIRIGRDSHCDVELADPYVSSVHATIERQPKGYLLRDQKSQNGTFVNGNRVVEAYLNIGDRIRMGEREFIFEDKPQLEVTSPFLKSKNEKWAQQLLSLPVFARTELPVLLLGASGTGKEVLARLTHEHSSRARGPFVSVNCSALSETLVESELFGHIKGSFTGAAHDRKGAFEAARGGTLFLDEVGDLPISLQPKLLRALENREIRPVGSDKNIDTNVRIVAATHKNLQAQVVKGLFRADLFYRLHVIKLIIPPLSERMEDFETLLYSFAREMRVRFSIEAIEELKQHTWPGNIRELRNVVARASAFYPGEYINSRQISLLLDSIPKVDVLQNPQLPTKVQGRSSLKEFEKEMIIQKLIENKGNQRVTAAQLGIPKSTLHDKVKSYGINVDDVVKKYREYI